MIVLMLIGQRTRRAMACALCLLWTLLLAAPRAAAQADTVIVDGTCGACEPRLQPLTVLGGPFLPFSLAPVSEVAVMSDGRYLVGPTMEPGQFVVFAPNGQLEQVVGREGDGPGEFQRIRGLLVGSGDTVTVLELFTATTLAPDFSYVRQAQIQTPLPDAWTIQPPNRLLVLATEMGSREPPNRVHILDGNGRPTESFAPAPRRYDRIQDVEERDGAVDARDNRVWFAKANQYSLELFTNQRLQTRIVRLTPWFEPWSDHKPMEGVESKPRPAIESVVEREDGLLMVVIRVADASWEPDRLSVAQGREGHNTTTIDRSKIFDSRIEVLDPIRGEVRSTGVFPDYLRRVHGSRELVHGSRQDEMGHVYIHVFRVEPSVR